MNEIELLQLKWIFRIRGNRGTIVERKRLKGEGERKRGGTGVLILERLAKKMTKKSRLCQFFVRKKKKDRILAVTSPTRRKGSLNLA